MEGRMQVMIGTPDSAFWRKFASIPESRDVSPVGFSSIEQACHALAEEKVLLIFCENQLADGTYEDLLAAAKNVRSEARVVVTGVEPTQFDSLGYCRARALGAFDVLGESYGPKDLEWVVLCAMRDEAGVHEAPSGATLPGAGRPN